MLGARHRGEAAEHEVEELDVARLASEDVAGHDQAAPFLGLEHADPERALEIDGEYGDHRMLPRGKLRPWEGMDAADERWLLKEKKAASRASISPAGLPTGPVFLSLPENENAFQILQKGGPLAQDEEAALSIRDFERSSGCASGCSSCGP
jgi:hypothetical protein